MAVNIPGLTAVIAFYVIILATGIWAAWKSRKEEKACTGTRSEIAMVGGRNLKFIIGTLTTSATYIGGGYINGIAEMLYSPEGGLLWTQIPLGYAFGLICASLFFVKPMRSNNYLTMIDPFQEKYGKKAGSIMFIPALLGSLLWAGAILAALGSTMSVILDLRPSVCIILSTCVVVVYTLLGGLYSVAYTDVIQLIFMIICMWICVPFAMVNKATENIAYTALNEVYQTPWIGKVDLEHLGRWLDDLLFLTLGSIPWQEYFQRVFSMTSVSQAKMTSYCAAVFCIFLAIPSALVGAVAASTDWNKTSYGLPAPFERGESGMILPIVLQYLCPAYVSVIGIGAIAAAVMSSADSALLSSSSMFANNIYKNILRKKASDRELLWVIRVSVVVFGTVASGLAFCSNSVYGLWFVSGELVYAIVFPQLICVLFIPNMNAYGSVAGFLVGLVMRLLAGEPFLNIAAVIQYPWYKIINGNPIQLFPFKTLTMLMALAVTVAVSYLTRFLSFHNPLHEKRKAYDVNRSHNVTSTPQGEITSVSERVNNQISFTNSVSE
ncbi:high-affinity choline transporter 1-like [Protopterus annectens]|uniref:high-affinity choline transporter 1-like n=1 Tax=Protopterus annectens TaxID=7888 RepID=UPI001CFC0CC0|nr:high-affinity choline transporter 1-like [Protopterus annectens]